MKALFCRKNIPAILLIGEAIYLSFVPVNIAHSIILFSLAGLYAFNQFLLSQEQPSLSTELAKLKSELEQAMEKQKELHEKKLMQLEDDVTRMSLNTVRNTSSSSSSSAAKVEAIKKQFQF